MTSIDIYRGGSIITNILIDEKTTFNHKLLGENVISIDVLCDSPIAIQIGDTISYQSEIFTLNRVPDITKKNANTFQYKADFEGRLYDLYNQLLFSIDDLCDFSYTAQGYEFIQLIVDSMNQIDAGWTLGTYDATDTLTIDFAGDSCRTALTKVAEAFKFEFSLVGKEITFKKTVGNVTNYTFEYGKGKGLYTLTRDQVSDQSVQTRIFGFGGTQNITEDYRSGAKRLVFDDSGNRYLENNVSLYGLKVGRYINEEIYPKRTSTLTDANMVFDRVDPKDPTITDLFNFNDSYIEDSALDFDLNGNKIDGTQPAIVFKTGDLAGNQFDIWKYDNATKRIYFNPYNEPDGYTMPNSTNHAHTGDTYTLIGIKLPDSYVAAAEVLLKAATQTYLNENSVPNVVYGLEIDSKYVKSQSISLHAGDIVHAKDTDLGVDNDIRVASISFPLVNPNKIKCEIADFVPYTIQELVVKTTIAAPKKAIIVQRKTAELARIAAMRQTQLRDLIFDPDNYFDVNRIKPLSIETMYLKVGSKSQNLELSGITFTPNYLGNANSFDVSSGNIIHLQYSILAGNTWAMTGQTFTGLTPALPYYLYAKCSKTALTGVWELTTEQKYFEDVDFYYFWTGVLYDVQSGIREFEPVTGMIVMNGGTIKAGRLQSVDGTQYFDLDTSQWFMGDSTNSIDYNVTTADTLTIHGAVMTDILISSIANIGDLLVNHLRTNVSPNRRIEINRHISDLLGDTNAFEIYDAANDLVLLMDDVAGEYGKDPLLVWGGGPGMTLLKGLNITRVLLGGVQSNGKGLNNDTSDSKIVVAAGSFTATATESLADFFAGVYGRAINAGTTPSYAGYFDGDIKVVGTVFSEGQSLDPAKVYHPANTTPQNLASGYTLYLSNLATGNMEWFLPNPANFSAWEEIEIVGWNVVDVSLKPLTGDLLNGYDNTQKRIVLGGLGSCVKMRSNGVDQWIITSLQGDFIAA